MRNEVIYIECIVEIFKPIYINGEITEYLISNYGNVYSNITKRLLTLSLNDAGYYRVNLTHNGKVYMKRVHILVAEAFIPNPHNKLTVNHKDGDKTNNHIDNLEWATYAENTQHAFRTGLNKGPRGMLNAKCIYTDEQIHYVCRLLSTGQYSTSEIRDITGVEPLTVRHIKRKVRWKHIACEYTFPEKIKSDRKKYKDKSSTTIEHDKIMISDFGCDFVNPESNDEYYNIIIS